MVTIRTGADPVEQTQIDTNSSDKTEPPNSANPPSLTFRSDVGTVVLSDLPLAVKAKSTDVSTADLDWALIDMSASPTLLPNLMPAPPGLNQRHLNDIHPEGSDAQRAVTIMAAEVGLRVGRLSPLPASLQIAKSIHNVILITMDQNLSEWRLPFTLPA